MYRTFLLNWEHTLFQKKEKNWEHTFKSRSELVFGYKKCSWLVVQALEHADEDQKKIVFVSTFNLANFQNKEDSA